MDRHPLKERTLVLVKPDGVARGLIGEILTRFEKRGLKIIGMKMVKPPLAHVKKHYPGDREWIVGMGNKTLETYAKHGKDPIKEIGTNDPYQIGKMVEKWNVDFLSSGPMIAMVIEGLHAILTVRKIVGHTIPSSAESGTIRGDFSIDSPLLANLQKRVVKNMIHASGEESEAEREINHWFREDELVDYERVDHKAMF